ncbi:hypothetical protein RclHR1_07430004 [Rhizophagus clarus]|uniref:Uncharacterized protein n=1 Tax=Rhizophagus clarus TaxID=94130 RepID=A0A2Z6SD13_9GLOM|nr:hypothetical protein RclHR1_07430004 [Rhizophagus clarus]
MSTHLELHNRLNKHLISKIFVQSNLTLVVMAPRIFANNNIINTLRIASCRKGIIGSPRGYSTAKEDEKLHAAIKYCSDLVKKHDPENYLISTFYPKHLQKVYFAIRALNIELIMVRESVSKPQLGSMRMQFWRETIDSTFKGNPPQQPIAQVLYDSLKICQLSPLFFRRIIDERDAQLNDPPYINNKDLESYGENTASCLLYLHLQSLGVEDIQADHAASHIGKSIGIVTILRGFPYLVSKRRMLLPSAITSKYNISQEEIFRKGPVKGLEDAIFEIATLAHDHLLTARTFLQSIPNQASPALLLAVTSFTIICIIILLF